MTPARTRHAKAISRARVARPESGFSITEICAPSQEKPSVHLVRRQGPHTYRHLFIADPHIDHPSFETVGLPLLQADLNEAVACGATIHLIGDLFDVMQSKDDPRASLGGLIASVNGIDYLDRCVNFAVQLLAPYAEHIALISDGNHETNILKRKHTDLVGRVCEGLRPYGFKGHRGWYQGWLILQQTLGDMEDLDREDKRRSLKIFYHHGTGGASPRSRGTLGMMKLADQAEGADIIISGHLHMGVSFPLHRYTLDNKYQPRTRTILLARTGTYKDDSGSGGWGVEKGFGPPTLGGVWLEYTMTTHEAGMRARMWATDAALMR
jgi:hypothetical protein